MFLKTSTVRSNRQKGMEFNPYITFRGRNKRPKLPHNIAKITSKSNTSYSWEAQKREPIYLVAWNDACSKYYA